MQRLFGASALGVMFALALPLAAVKSARADEPCEHITEIEGVFHTHRDQHGSHDVFGYHSRREIHGAKKAGASTFEAVGRLHVHNCGHGHYEICLHTRDRAIDLNCGHRIDLLYLAKALDGRQVHVKGSVTIHGCRHGHFDLHHNLSDLSPCFHRERYSVRLRGTIEGDCCNEHMHIRNLCIPLCDMRTR